MEEPRAKRHAGLPWTILLFERIPLAPIWIGLLITGLWLSVYLIYTYLVGGRPSWDNTGLWMELLHGVMIAYALTFTAYWFRGTVRDLHALRPALACSETEFRAEVREVTEFERCPLVVATLIGGAIGLGAAFNPGGWVSDRPALGDPVMTWVILKSVFLFLLIARAVYVSIALTRRLSRTGERRARVDLLDVIPLMPFARNGLRGALLLLGWIVLTSLSLLAPWSGDVAIGGLCVVLGLAVTALVGPVVGVHRRIHEAKQIELERIRVAIGKESSLRVGSRGEWQPPDAHLSNLIVYKGLIESVNTWLFDLPALLKFSLIILVGVGSWLGQAFVERLLGVFID
jgi:hypothetical protein